MRERLETVAGNVKAINRYQPLVKAAVTDADADALLDRMGDEILQTQNGQANPYDVDDASVWMNWDRRKKHADVFRFSRG